MSDSASNPNIEDVLSSIRRLVSEEPEKRIDQPEAADDATVEALVLTPAFRISDDSSDDVGQFESDGGEIHAALTEPEDFDDDPEVFVAETPDASVTQIETHHADSSDSDSAEFVHHRNDEPQASEDSPKENAPEIEEQTEPAETQQHDDGHHDVPVAFEAEEAWSHPQLEAIADPEEENIEDATTLDLEPSQEPDIESQSAVQDLSLEQRIAGLEAAIESAPQEWEPDGSEDGTSDETRPLELDQINIELNAALGVADDEVEEQAEAEDVAVEPWHDPDAVADDFTSDPLGAVESGVEDAAEASAEESIPDPDLDEVASALIDQGETVAEPVDVSAGEEPTEAIEALPGLEADVEITGEYGSGENPVHADIAEPDDATEIEAEQEALLSETEHADGSPETEIPHAYDDEGARAPEADEDDQDYDAHAPEFEPQEPDNILADDVAMLDEETLREMVADIVREELQGVLGERIT